MQAVRVETVVAADGTVTLRDLRLQPGDAVEVIVLVTPPARAGGQGVLQGEPFRYDRPFDPVAEDDWEACR